MAFDILLSEAQIQARIRELAAQIRADCSDEDLLLVGILKGSLFFLADLAKALDLDSAEIDFMQVASYGNEKSSSGVVQIKKDLDTNIEGRSVLIVEDIVDTGTTLSYLRKVLETRRPKSLKVVSLLSKLEARKVGVQVEYVGFEIPNQFVVGYGLDYGEKHRMLRDVVILP